VTVMNARVAELVAGGTGVVVSGTVRLGDLAVKAAYMSRVVAG